MPKNYDYDKLFEAYVEVTEEGSTVRDAAAKYGVPKSTLWDRVTGKTPLKCTSKGRPTSFDDDQEIALAKHIEKMASFGYGYSVKEMVQIANDYARELNLRKGENPLRPTWFDRFKKRHPFLKIEKGRAKVNLQLNVFDYFENLKATLEKHDLLDKPHLIFNIDQKALDPHHTAPKTVNSRRQKSLVVTPPEGCITTLIAAGNAMGHFIPPYFIFKGEKFHKQYIEEGTPGVDGTVSETGWSNSSTFKTYLTGHFLKYVLRHNVSHPVLIIYDGHKSHITPGILDWAKDNNVIFFFLPAHTSHFLQPLDVACFRSFESAFVSAKHQHHKFLHHTDTTLDYTEVCKAACEAYMTALQPSSLISAFRNTGIWPFRGLDAIDPTIDPMIFSPSDPFTEDAV